jgi:hypothetical protein
MSMKRRPPHAAQKWRGFRFNVRISRDRERQDRRIVNAKIGSS